MPQACPYQNRLLTTLFLFALVLLYTATAAAAPVGQVILATGNVWRLGPEGQEPLQRHAPVQEGDHLQTGDGNLTLRMADNALISLQPGSELIIHQYRAASENADAAIRLELKQGNLRSRTGQIGQSAKHRYRLDTPFAALGIRGTDYTANLHNGHLGVYVHSGAIRLAPFSAETGCMAGQLGACNTPLAADLSADDNAWLSLKAGDTIERIGGTPDFIQPQKSSAIFTGGLYDATGNLLEPSESIQYRFEFVDDSDPLSDDSLDAAPSLPDETAEPEAAYYLTDNSTTPLSEAQIRDYLRHTTLRMDTYTPLATHPIYNMQLTLRQQLQLSSWFDTRYQRLWGKTESIQTILAARYWPEGLFWQVLPESLDELGAQNSDWVQQLQLDQAALWQLPLDRYTLAFTPGEGPEPDPDTQLFTTRWSQPLGDAAGNASAAEISNFKADTSGRFQMTIRTDGYNYTLRGAVGDAGTLFAANDYLELRGHWEGETLVLLVTEKNSDQQWMFGLRQSGTSSQPLLAQWQKRQTNGVTWGHWADFASLDPEALSRLDDSLPQRVSNRHFVLETPEIDNLPSSGQASFSLAAAEAVYSGATGLRPAQVLDPSLNVDFDQRSFVARFDVAVPGLDDSIAILGAGRFDDQGLMQSDDRLSNSQMEGSFGPGGETAGLLFEHDLNDSDYVSGITHWQQTAAPGPCRAGPAHRPDRYRQRHPETGRPLALAPGTHRRPDPAASGPPAGPDRNRHHLPRPGRRQ